MEEDFVAFANAKMTELDDEEKNMMPDLQSPKENMTNEEKKSLELAMPRIETSSNDLSNTPKKVGFA